RTGERDVPPAPVTASRDDAVSEGGSQPPQTDASAVGLLVQEVAGSQTGAGPTAGADDATQGREA
ncbi:MAG: hypothetical protein M3Q22_00750, partial [Actinomycetota bacterium]|nr:hypothetical protein [Actinomycetota bacterium]